jgi:hypothetical protein
VLVRRFSSHFVERWVQWCGRFPSIEEVNLLIQGAQQLRPQVDLLQRGSDGTLMPYKLLAEFWNDAEGIVIRVDECVEKAVTLIWAGRKKSFRRASGAMRNEE